MALDSAIGYVSGSLSNPPTPGPDPVKIDSDIGYVTGSLTGPLYVDSQIGYAFSTLKRPHHPAGVQMSDGSVRYIPVLTLKADGTLR